MRVTTFRLIFAFVIILYSQKGIGQCYDCKVYPGPAPLPRATADSYKNFYKQKYIDNAPTDVMKKRHSNSVAFSRQSIIDFYEKVFVHDVARGYAGINIHLVSFGTQMFPRQEDNYQIGLMMSAADANCKSDFNEFNILNNSFNQSDMQNDESPWTYFCGSTMAQGYIKNYSDNFNDSDHTNYIHYKAGILKILRDFLLKPSHIDHKGVRIYFISYKKLNVACGQVTRDQITIVLVPVDKNGKDDFDGLKAYLESSEFTQDKSQEQIDKLRSGYNHGELCPNNCK